MGNKDKLGRPYACINCLYYIRDTCRRYPPQEICLVSSMIESDCQVGSVDTNVVSSFPKVKGYEWCGEFETRWEPETND